MEAPWTPPTTPTTSAPPWGSGCVVPAAPVADVVAEAPPTTPPTLLLWPDFKSGSVTGPATWCNDFVSVSDECLDFRAIIVSFPSEKINDTMINLN